MVVVDECRATGGGVADAIVADLAEHRIGKRLGSVRAVDSFVPLGPATSAVLVGVDQIVAAAVAADRRKAQGGGARMTPRGGRLPRSRLLRAASLGSLPAGHPWVRRADELRADARPSALSELDGAGRFDPAVHLRPVERVAARLPVQPARRRAHRGRSRGRGRGRQLDRLVHRPRRIRAPSASTTRFRLVQEMAPAAESPLTGDAARRPSSSTR